MSGSSALGHFGPVGPGGQRGYWCRFAFTAFYLIVFWLLLVFQLNCFPITIRIKPAGILDSSYIRNSVRAPVFAKAFCSADAPVAPFPGFGGMDLAMIPHPPCALLTPRFWLFQTRGVGP